ncbi:MAG: hypothetical protein BWY74_02530 [Firmicutes bacterium ADurb.Bin419]|nr:MAG: hypothetical protein BWY74_02530 [Firmicutes bacterium ADurb.Bin419]
MAPCTRESMSDNTSFIEFACLLSALDKSPVVLPKAVNLSLFIIFPSAVSFTANATFLRFECIFAKDFDKFPISSFESITLISLGSLSRAINSAVLVNSLIGLTIRLIKNWYKNTSKPSSTTIHNIITGGIILFLVSSMFFAIIALDFSIIGRYVPVPTATSTFPSLNGAAYESFFSSFPTFGFSHMYSKKSPLFFAALISFWTTFTPSLSSKSHRFLPSIDLFSGATRRTPS